MNAKGLPTWISEVPPNVVAHPPLLAEGPMTPIVDLLWRKMTKMTQSQLSLKIAPQRVKILSFQHFT
jgi:hypothetical protein